MKNLTAFILIVTSPLALFSQVSELPDVRLRGCDERIVSAADLVGQGDAALVIIWDDAHRQSLDQWVELGDELRRSGATRLRMISIYEADCGSHQQAKALLAGLDIELEAYSDVNGELRRVLSLPETPQIMLFSEEGDLLSHFMTFPNNSLLVFADDLSDALCQQDKPYAYTAGDLH